MAKDFVVRWQKPDGTWLIDLDERMSFKKAKTSVQSARTLVGALGQVWSYHEAVQRFTPPHQRTNHDAG